MDQTKTQKKPVSRRSKITYMTELALLTAIVIVMAVTPLGYMYIGVMPITLLVVPVAVGAVVLGPLAGTFLGFVFGLSSILQPTGLALLSVMPVQGLLVAIVPRLFVGLVPGLVFKGLGKTKMPRSISSSIACLLAPITNTILYLTFFVLLLGQYMASVSPDVYGYIAGKGFWASLGLVFASVAVNAVVEAAACLIIAAAVSNALLHTVNRSR